MQINKQHSQVATRLHQIVSRQLKDYYIPKFVQDEDQVVPGNKEKSYRGLQAFRLTVCHLFTSIIARAWRPLEWCRIVCCSRRRACASQLVPNFVEEAPDRIEFLFRSSLIFSYLSP